MTKHTQISLQGWVRPSVIDHEGKTIWEGVEQRNLLLDQGLNRMAAVHIADLFSYGVKGTGTGVTVENVTGTYTQGAGTTTVTRATGARDFTPDDVGRLIKFNPGQEAKITAFTSATQVEVDRTQSGAITGQTIKLYYVNLTGLDTESGIRFLSGTLDKPLSDATVTAATVAQFTSGDVGKFIYFIEADAQYEILSYTDGQHVEVDISSNDLNISGLNAIVYEPSVSDNAISRGRTNTYSAVSGENSTIDGTGGNLGKRTMRRTFIFDPEPADSEVITGSFARVSGTITGTGASRTFGAGDVGKVISFGGSEYKITAQAGASCTVTPTTGPSSSTDVTLYGFTSYSEVGFSDDGSPGNNLNIRVLLASPALVQAPTGLYPGQQLKVKYTLTAALEPNSSAASNPTVNDSGNQMSGSKSGNAVVERLAISSINDDGTSSATMAGLEPCEAASMGYSTSSAALVPMNGPDRSAGVATTPLVADAYNDGEFTLAYRGTFGLNDAIATNWRSLMIWDESNNTGLFTHLFTSNQKKDALHVLNVVWKKTWSRILS